MWDPGQYLRHVDERSRPFGDLVGRIGADPASVRSVVDLGCGPGHLTVTLSRWWPQADLVGVDNSPEMIERARADHPGATWVLEDLRSWSPDAPVDVVVSNATLQWVTDHRTLLPRIVADLRPGGWLAFQVPGNDDAPAHRAVAEVVRSPRWSERLAHLAVRTERAADPADYARDLFEAGCDHVDAWETTYVHVLRGDDPVLEWLSGTTLRPILDALGADHGAREAFLAELASLLKDRYPAGPHGTLFPFRRVFAVGRRAS